MTTTPVDTAMGPFPTERARPASVPAPAPGLTLLGTPQGAHDQPHGMARRADGQVLQLTPLLYAVLAELVDAGEGTDTATLADRVRRRTGRDLAADDVEFLVEERLAPLGVLADVGPDRPVTASPLLGLRLRWEVSDPARTRRITRPFAVLFNPLVVAAVLAAFGTAATWLLFHRGLALAARQAVYEPLWLLVLLALTLVSAGFHEFGHAAACRRAGATPGAMGVGLYLLWPAFYTDVTDAYRLDRRGRLLVDLGGLYFNCVFAVGGILAWGLTGVDALLLVYPVQLLQMARQLLPFLRYDGYHVLADVTGVPDLFTQIRPTLATLLPRNWGRPSPSRLRPRARALVLAWTLVTVPLLVGGFLLLLSALPALLATTADSLLLHRDALVLAARTADVPMLALRAVQVLVLGIAPLSIVYLSWRIGRRGLRAAWARTDGNLAGRATVAAGVAALLALLVWTLLPDDDWQPIADDGAAAEPVPATTVTEVTAAGSSPVRDTLRATSRSAPQPPGTDAGPDPTAGAAPTPTSTPPRTTTPEPPDGEEPLAPAEAPVAPVEAAAPTDEPTTPTTSTATPRDQWLEVHDLPATWTWSWARPAAPRAHDNVALAAVDRDATWMRSFSTELVVAPDGTADHRNEAHAYAACTDCGAVAAAFQVVLLPGEHRVVVPRNLAGAANEDCTRCVVTAVANQLVVSTTEAPDATVRAELEAVLADLEPLRDQLDELTATEVRAAFQDAQRRVLAILAAAEPTGDTPAFSTEAEVTDGEATETHSTTSTDGPTSTVEPVAGTDADETADDGTTATDGSTTVDGDAALDDSATSEATTAQDTTTVDDDPGTDSTPEDDPTTEPTPQPGDDTSTNLGDASTDDATGDDTAGTSEDGGTTTDVDGSLDTVVDETSSQTDEAADADADTTTTDPTDTTTTTDTTDPTTDTTDSTDPDDPTGSTTTATTTAVATRDEE